MARIERVVMLSYDRVQKVNIDLGLENICALYATSAIDEHFFHWIPSKFAMIFRANEDRPDAITAAVETTIKALYRAVPKSEIRNLEIWLDGQAYTELPQSSQS